MKQQPSFVYLSVYQHVTGAVVSSGQIERDFGVCGDVLPPKRNHTAPQFFQTQVSARVNFDSLPTFEDMPQSPMTAAVIRAALPFVWVHLSSVTSRMWRKRTWRTRAWRRLAKWGTVMGWTVVKRKSTT